ncbi:aminomethyl-transferring glycine dehydrogenase [Thalassobaculum sp. OXR-137]|uniref:aminomethyl-transferring glycine dehydrogenase n=1 Tax=Thalassobaculum sp. OXR-137 TaxID=3100173 RepID=UPI002AC92842|nr:aminomethyl-transferring glycine dehydrogenase [Thalassobaculum sp. OXR-137]WPZ34830.1 aminomethyl-transferring glycine dehydrogenase [Thalassobaculum sp. OXR-137]
MTDTRMTVEQLHDQAAFIGRHIGPSPDESAAMLAALGYDSLDALSDAALPRSIHLDQPLALDAPKGEAETLAELAEIASQNKVATSLIGMGYYDTVTPAVIKRNVLENPSWYTAYTPYQAEISQGRLEALLNFQTMVADLTGMDIANASLLDEGTAAAEAMALGRKLAKNKGAVFFVSKRVHPQTIDVLRTRAEPIGIEIEVGDEFAGLPAEAFGYLLQYPATRGSVNDYRDIVERAHGNDAIVVVAADLLALTLLTPPGDWGADIVIGTTQRFGVPMGFGGPHAAYFATRDTHKRNMPGRIVGVSVDAAGRPAYRLALQTREQHIRREKATSNICTAQVLLAVIASMYAVYHGPEGLTRIATRVNRLAAILAEGLRRLGYKLDSDDFFDTITVNAPDHAATIWEAARVEGLNLRFLEGAVGISLDETSNRQTVERIWSCFWQGSKAEFTFEEIEAAFSDTVGDTIPQDLRRTSAFLTHPVFHENRSETEMLRYLRRLSDKDIALDRSMIPLGSCTMKLNATTEMIPVTWPEFANIHPFAPSDQTQGYLRLIGELERMLASATGYAAVSVQPNSGAQGEYAGLLVIRAYHRARGEAHRDICLIPSSAHGTNPASAAMAGMKVVVVACDDKGNVDVDDLKAKAEAHADNLAALMITYPSTHGVFEVKVREICQIVHDNGGQVYTDGANLNALVGLCSPCEFGSDVSHMNLHKTFCIPHGGGGPGVGPIGVAQHLVPFLPGHEELDSGENAIGAVSAAPYGSAGILAISWAYIRMMGAEGLKKATQSAILNANYLAKRLSDHYPVLYAGPDGLVAHECIIDLRPIKDACGVSVDDVAKRLMDYGFHAPTMSFPVAGTLMIEPTESESKAEIDRFCDAMIAIREEIRAVENGDVEVEASALRNAPHTSDDLLADAWDRPYSRRQAAFPLPGMEASKYWPPVSRIDNVYGDRHVICTCPPIEAYQDAAE